MNKRGFELSINMIIVVAMALIALIIIILIFSGGTTDFTARLKGIVGEIWGMKPNLTAS